MKRAWRSFCRDERGNMAVLFAFGFTLSALVSAVAVDAAALYHERRLLQAGVDLAAISAAADPSRAAEIAQSVLAGARLLAPAGMDGLVVTPGHYDPSRPDIGSRFTPSGMPVNAVAVRVERTGTLYFASGLVPIPIVGAQAVATVSPQVSFSIGSRLASLNGGLANAILSRLLGTTISLSVLDYRALAETKVDAFDFLAALGQEMGITVGTYGDVLAVKADAGKVAAALAALSAGPVRTTLQAVAGGGSGRAIPLASLLSLGTLGDLRLGSEGRPRIALTALEILSAAAALAEGDRQVSLNLGAGVPGLVSLRLDLAVGEPPQGAGWFAIGPVGTAVRTAQLRLRLRAQLLGGPILLGAGVRLPLWLDLAPSEARVAAATCPSPSAPHGSATINVRPGLLRLGLGDLNDAALVNFGTSPPQSPVDLVNVLLLKITGTALVELAQSAPVPVTFSSVEIAAGLQKTARTTTPVSSLAGSLLGELDITVNVLGLGLASPSVIAKALRDLLAPLAPTLDQTIIGTLGALGLGIGEADIRVYGVRCDHAVLVG